MWACACHCSFVSLSGLFLYIQILSCIGFVKKKVVYISIKVVKATVVLWGLSEGSSRDPNLIRPNLIPKNMYQ